MPKKDADNLVALQDKLAKSHDKLAESYNTIAESNKHHDLAKEEERKVIMKIMETKQQNLRVMTPAAKGVFDSPGASVAISVT